MSLETGTIDWFSRQKKYGFIISESGERRFFHIRNVKQPTSLRSGVEVKFQAVDSDKGPQAEQVQAAHQRDANTGSHYQATGSGSSVITHVITFFIGAGVMYALCATGLL